MIKRTVFFLISTLFGTGNLWAQLEQGDWMVGGFVGFSQLSNKEEDESRFTLNIDPQLAVMVSNSVMVGGQFAIFMSGDSEQTQIETSQILLARHYFKKIDQWQFFYGGTLKFSKINFAYRGSDYRISKRKRLAINLGALLFFNESFALESLIAYQAIDQFKNNNQSEWFYTSGNLGMEFQCRFFLHRSRFHADQSKIDYSLESGDYLIGGRVIVNNGFALEPQVFRFLSSGFAIGLTGRLQHIPSFRYLQVAVYPSGRKYFWPTKKRKLFLEAGVGYSSYFDRTGRSRKWLKSYHGIHQRIGIGMTTMLSATTSLDVFAEQEYEQGTSRDDPNPKYSRFTFGISLNGYIK